MVGGPKHESAQALHGGSTMLRLNPNLVEQLSHRMISDFEERLARRLRAVFVEATSKCDEPELRRFIRSATMKASTFGIVSEWDVMRYVQNALLFGLRLEHHPNSSEVAQVLQDHDVDGGEKMDRIERFSLPTVQGEREVE